MLTERRAAWPGVVRRGEDAVDDDAADEDCWSSRLLAELPRALAELRLPRGAYVLDVEDIRTAFPRCPLGSDDDVVYVQELKVRCARRVGIGGLVMRTLTRLADEHLVTIVLVPTAFGSRRDGLTQDELVAWYGRLGFETWYNANLIRRPTPQFTRGR